MNIKRVLLVLILIAGLSGYSQTPQQVINGAAGFQAYSDRNLQVADTYLLALMTLGTAASPASVLAASAGYYAYSARDLQVAQTYLLSQISGGLGQTILVSSNGPFTSIETAISNAPPFWTVRVAPGYYYISNPIVMPLGVALVGSGPGRTTFYMDTNIVRQPNADLGRCFDVTNANVFKDFTLTKSPLYPYLKIYPFRIPTSSTVITNVVFDNLNVYGDTDLIEIETTTQADWYRGYWGTAFDGIINAGGGYSTSRFYQVTIDAGTNVFGTAWGAIAGVGNNNINRYFTAINMGGRVELHGGSYQINGGNPAQQAATIVGADVIVDGGANIVFTWKPGDSITGPNIPYVIEALTNVTVYGPRPITTNMVLSAFNGTGSTILINDVTNAPAAGYVLTADGNGNRWWSANTNSPGPFTIANGAAIGYITNAPATGNATITWDASKDYSMVSTSVAVTVNITGLQAGQVFHSILVLSNQSATARAVTGGGFSMMTNNINTPASALNMTNNDTKHQRLVLKADGVAGVITNVWAYQVFDP